MNASRLIAVTIATVGLVACGGETPGAVPASTMSTAPTSATAESTDGSATNTSGSNTDEPSSSGATVTISRSRFDNVELRVAPGTTVTFVNTDSFDHTVTSRDDSPVEFDSGTFGQDETFEFTFDEPGEYAYFCQIHPTMRAVVIVE